jgi:hypothetical protein
MTPKEALSDLTALSALTTITVACQEAAAMAQRLHALADTITATIDVLAPATGNTVEAVYEPFWDGDA